MTELRDRAAQPHGAQPESAPGGVQHDTFTVTRCLSGSPSDVFRAFADRGIRRRWFRLPGSGASYEHDFRVGGGETAHSTVATLDTPPERLEYSSRYLDIIPEVRIVYVYEAHVGGVLRWTSLVTVELDGDADGTELSWTEQVAFVAPTGDGSNDLAHVRGGTRLRLNGLVAALESPGTPGRTTAHT